MSKSTKKQAPSTTGSDSVSGGSRTKNTKENQMNQVTSPIIGVFYLALRVSFIIAIITLMRMPSVHYIVDLPLYQAAGGIILSFLIYLELHQYFASRDTAPKGDKKRKQASANPLTDGLEYLQTPIK